MPTEVVTVWPCHYDKPIHSLLCKVNVISIKNYVNCLNPAGLSVPVSTIDYDNLF